MEANKLKRLSLETLSSQVLEFEGKDRTNAMRLCHPPDRSTSPKYKLL
jgi:hypothetical protein